ncbi:MAG: 4Fe-4S binding protein [Dehalococcoidia bacterium]|nr:4Fe-4S binding protein [Dehalococcoidia bacterium]
MAPRIDPDKCNLCGICVENCPGDVFADAPGRDCVAVARPIACWHCGTCEVDCPTDAIHVDLPIMMVA